MEPVHHPHYVGSSGANLIQQKQISLGDSEGVFADIQQQNIHPALVDLCAAAHGELADMHSTAASSVVEGYTMSPSSQQHQQQQHGLIDLLGQAGTITSASSPVGLQMHAQPLSVVNPSLVSVQPSKLSNCALYYGYIILAILSNKTVFPCPREYNG